VTESVSDIDQFFGFSKSSSEVIIDSAKAQTKSNFNMIGSGACFMG